MSRKCPTLIAFNREGKIVPIFCKSWSCPRCQVINARMWAWRVRIHVSQTGQTAFFWTLTLGSGYRKASDGFAAIPRLWDRLRKDVTEHGGHWSYVAFVEGQPSRGYMPHFHIISHVPPYRRIKDMAVHAGFGHQAKSEPVTSDKASFYVAKYATKQSPFTPKGFRRVRCSQDWAKLPEGEWPELIVWKRDQSLMDYLLYVNWLSGVDPEVLYTKYQLALEDYGLR